MAWAKRAGIEMVIGGEVEPSVGRSIKEVETKAGRLGQALSKARLGKGIAGDVIKYRRAIDQLKARQDKTGGSSLKLGRAIELAGRKLKSAERAATSYGIDVGKVAREHSRLTREVERTERAMGRLEIRERNKAKRSRLMGGMPGLGRLAGGLGGAVGIGASFRSAIDFDSALIRLRTVVSSDPAQAEQEVEAARRSALEFTRHNLSSKTEVLDVNYALNSAGLGAEASRLGASVVLKVAKVTSGMPKQVGGVIASTLNNMGDAMVGTTQEKIARIGDLLAKTQFKFQIDDFGQLGESMKMANAELAANKVALEQGLTLLGVLNNTALRGSMAGTALSASMRQMSKASREFGFDIERNADGQLDYIKTLENLSDAIGGFDNMDQETLDRLQKAFGDEGGRAIKLLGLRLKELKAAQRDVAEGSKGLVDKSYEHFLNSAAGKMTRFRNNVDLVGSGLANTLLPGVNAILEPITWLTMRVGQLVEQFPILGQAVGGAAAAFVAFKVARFGARIGGTLASDAFQTAKGGVDFFRYRGWSKEARTRRKAGRRARRGRGGLVGNLVRSVAPGVGGMGPLPLPVSVVNMPAGGLGGGLDSGGGKDKGKTGKSRSKSTKTGKSRPGSTMAGRNRAGRGRLGRLKGLGRRVLGGGRLKGLGRSVLKVGGLALGGLSMLPSLIPAGIAGGAAPEVATKGVGKTVASKGAGAAGKTVAKKGAGAAGKAVAKGVGKGVGKSLLKKVPLVGALAGGLFGIQRALKGDFLGALGEVASGLASTVPGLGTVASLAIAGALVAKDVAQAGKDEPANDKPVKDHPAKAAGDKPASPAEPGPGKTIIEHGGFEGDMLLPATLGGELPVIGAPEGTGPGRVVMDRAPTPAPEPAVVNTPQTASAPGAVVGETQRQEVLTAGPDMLIPGAPEAVPAPGSTVAEMRARDESAGVGEAEQAQAPVSVKSESRQDHNMNITINQTVSLAAGMTESGIKHVLKDGREELERHLEDWFERYLIRRQEVSFA